MNCRLQLTQGPVPRPQALSSKMGKEREPGNIREKAVDFQRVIIHGIIVGHSYLSNILYVI